MEQEQGYMGAAPISRDGAATRSGCARPRFLPPERSASFAFVHASDKNTAPKFRVSYVPVLMDFGPAPCA